MARNIFHVDFNCFYAAVEMQRRPEIRNKPVAVCGSQEDRHGIVLTANYVAKPFGVKTGMAIWQAKQCCPNLAVVPPDMREYIRISRLARGIYEDYTDQIEPFGLDESWLDVTGSVGLFGSPMSMAKEISDRIKFELGITASIGVADNKITAKLGSDYKKPDAITRIEADNYREIAYPLPVRDLLYVGPATERKLNGLGIYTIGQLAQCPVNCLTYKLGKMGAVLHTFANGKDPSPVKRSDYAATVKSVGNSATTPRDLVCDEDVHLMLYLLAESVATRMRDLAARCLVVEVYARDTGLLSLTRQRKLGVPTCSSAEIAQIAFELFRANYRWEKPVRSIGVRGAELVEADAGVQTSLLDDDAKREKWEQIDATMDHLRQRYGYMSIRRAVTCSDPQLGRINPRDDHTVHPVSVTLKGDILMSLPYGFMLAPDGSVSVDQEKATTVRTIYQQYLSGMSLKGIADFLFTQGIPSPRGKAQWTQAVINDLLSNQRYIGSIISFDEFFMAQGEKGKRSNLDEDTNQRKATRYNSQSVLSGLLVCGECGRNYRRITRPSGEVVWRCANRVEYGKRFCKHSPSIPEQQIRDAICDKLSLVAFDKQAVKKHIDFVSVRSDGALEVGTQQMGLSLSQLIWYNIPIRRYRGDYP